MFVSDVIVSDVHEHIAEVQRSTSALEVQDQLAEYVHNDQLVTSS